jgi:hypothetical protein
MTEPPSAQDIALLSQTLLLGTHRRPVTLPLAAAALLPPSSTLSPALLALVLAGQHARFERPAPPAFVAASAVDLVIHADPRPMLSEPARRLLKQLLGMTKGDESSVFLIACRDRAAAHDLRIHPFDLPAFAHLLRNAPSQPAMTLNSNAPLDAESWKAMPPDLRAEALRRLRQTSPDAARALLEATFRSETAAHRAVFLSAMAANLGIGDLPFLETAAKDRADAVRTAALRLIGTIPGTDLYRERLGRVGALFMAREAKGKKPAALSLIKERKHLDIFQYLEGLRFADLAEKFGFAPEEFIEALPSGEDVIFLALIVTAAGEGDTGLAAALIRRLSGPRALPLLWRYRPDGLVVLDHTRPALVEALVDSVISGAFPDGQTLHALYRMNRGPLSEGLASKVLALESWRSHVGHLTAPEADKNTPNAVNETALLIPDTLLDTFLASIAPLSPHLTHPARLFAEFCKSLAETTPVAPLPPSPSGQ